MQGKWASSHHMDKGRKKSLSKSIFGIKLSQKAEFVHDLNGISFICSAEVWAFKFFIHNSVFMKLILTAAKFFLQSDMKIACKEKK